MDHHGFYTDLNSSFSSITNSSNFSENNLPSISNYKYQPQQPTLSGSIYQQPVQTIPDHQQQHQQQHQQHQQQQIPPTIKQQIPQTQININNCNNNIFFPPHDEGLFDSNTSSSCAAVSSNINSNNSNNNNTSNQKNNNIIGYVRKAESGGENITYNINNINTNIVNNINNNNNTTTNSSTSSSSNSTNNPVGLVNGGDIYGGNNQYHHQINKNGETIINFTNNNNLNHNNTNNSSMPLDSVSASSQNYYYHSNQSNLGQQTFEASSIHSQNTSTSTNSYLNPILSANKSMGTTGTGLNHSHHHHQSASGTTNSTQQSAPPPPSNGSYISGNNNSLSHDHTGNAATVASYGDFPESISTAAKIINNFESKNPIKYQTTNRMPSGYYKSDYPAPQYSTTHSHHLPPHHGINYGIYSGHPSAALPTGINKMSSHSTGANPLHSYESSYSNRVPRKPSHYPTSQYYPAPSNPMPQQAHSLDDSRNHYSRTVIQHPTAAYHHPLPPPPPSHHNYGAYYTNGVNRYSMPYPSYSHYPPNQQPSVRNESCSKSAQNYAKPSGQMVSVSESPSNYTLTHPNVYQPTKKTTTEYYSENPYLPHHYFDDPIGHLNSCAKKASRTKVNSSDVYIPQSTSNLYTDHHGLQQYHHQPGGNVMRNINYQQPMPKVYNSPYTLPTEALNSCEHAGYYQNVNYPYKTSDHHQMVKGSTGPKMNPALSSKQFKNYYDFPLQQPPQFASNLPQYHTMQAKHPEKLKISIDLEDQIAGSKIPKMRDVQHPTYAYDYSPYYHQYHMPSRNVPIDGEKNQINLRDFLSSWNEIDDDEEGGEKRHQTHPLGILDELNEHVEHVERSIMREYNPMFGQKPHDSIINGNSIITGIPVTANLLDSGVDIRKQQNQLAEVNSIVNETAPEKLYVLESIEVPISELNKYKHLSVINKLPENVVPIEADKEFYDVESSMKFIDEIESNHEKYYKNDLDEEVDFYQQTEMKKLCVEPLISEVKTEPIELKEEVNSPDNASQTEVSDNPTSRKSFRKKSLKSAKAPKIKEKILKLKKEKILKPDHRKLRITKKYRKYALNPRPSSNVKSLKIICIDFVNTSTYRNYFREQLSVKIKCSKRQLLDDIKKKFNFDSIKKQQSPINQKMNHSVRINSLQEICDKVLQDKPYNENDEQRSQDNSDIDSDSNADSDEIFEAHSVEIDAENEVEKFLEQCNENASEKSCKKIEVDDDVEETADENEEPTEDLPQTPEAVPLSPQCNNLVEESSPIVVPTLKNLCKTMLHDLNVNVVENIVYEPSSLHELCESVIYSNRQYFLIEEVSNVPKLQDLCKVILSETNIFINIDETENVISNDVCMLTQPNVMENYGESSLTAIEDDPIYMVEDNNAVELFSASENLNLFEKSELFRKIQSVANIDDDDEILKAIGELHRDNDNNECNNNNNCNVSNMNLSEANELCTVGSVDNTKFDSVTSFMSYANDDLMHSIQYEEIIPIDLKLEQSKKIIESLRCKYFNRKDVTQRVTIIRKLLKKYLRYQRGNRCKLLWQKNIQHFHEKWLKLQTKSLLLQSNKNDKINRKLSSSYQPNDTILNSQNTNDHHHQIINNESHKIAKEDICYYPITKPTKHNDSSNTFLDKFDDIEQMENNIPQLLPSIFPSINEYKIERPISCHRSESQVKDISDSKKRKLTFDESLLSIDKMYSKIDNYNGNGSSSSSKDETTFPQNMDKSKYRRESSHRSSSDKHRHDRVYSDQKSRHHERSHHRDRSRNRYHDNRSRHRSRSNHRDNRHHRSYHRSSRHQHYQHRNDQIVHSEARRLIIPSYKLYDKNLDIKLKTKPYVKIERTECVDDMGKHFM